MLQELLVRKMRPMQLCTGGGGSVYDVSSWPRSKLLDRYASHRVDCDIYQTALRGM